MRVTSVYSCIQQYSVYHCPSSQFIAQLTLDCTSPTDRIHTLWNFTGPSSLPWWTFINQNLKLMVHLTNNIANKCAEYPSESYEYGF